MFSDAFPIISTPDVDRALGFYRDLLEGEVEYQFPRFALWVYADSCDAAVERLWTGGATITEEPTDQPWGERVARALDHDGNEVIVGQRAG